MNKPLQPPNCVGAAVGLIALLGGCGHSRVIQAASAAPAAPPVQAASGPGGLTTLQYQGVNLLADGTLSAQTITLQNADGTTTQGSTTPTATTYDPAAHRLTQTYPWGTVACRYVPAGSRLNLAVSVTDTSPQTLQQLTLQLLAIRFPAMPKDWVPNYVYVGSNTGDPTVITAHYGSGALAVCNEDVAGKPLLVGFPGRADFTSRPIVVSTAKGWVLSPYLDPYIARPIAPGATDTYHLSLRFGASGSSEKTLAGDVLARFAGAYPQTLHWPDHRAIGALHLSEMETNTHSATNPSGWFADPTVDVVSPAGKTQFRARLMKYAGDSIKVLQDTHAQGMIVWDIEGQQYPQPTSYIGDPRLLPTLSPAMDADADAFFSAFRKAGFRVGLCIRPQQLTRQADGGYAQEEPATDAQIVALLVDKIRYANRRWGCTLFYCDSNGDPNVPYAPTIFQQVTQRIAALGIQALIMPEHQDTRYYAYTAPYDELRGGVTQTPQAIKDVYPGAFTALYVPDGDVDKNRAALVQGVKGGDVLLFRGWWPDTFNADVTEIYHAAGR